MPPGKNLENFIFFGIDLGLILDRCWPYVGAILEQCWHHVVNVLMIDRRFGNASLFIIFCYITVGFWDSFGTIFA